MKDDRLLSRIYFLVRPFGRKKLGLLLAVSLVQAILQVIGVTSVYPFFAIATDPEAFRSSEVGEIILGWLPGLNDSQLLMWTGAISLLLLLLSSLVNIATQFLRNHYTHGFAHWLRQRFINQLAAQPYGYFLQSDPAILNKKLNADIQNFSSGVLLPVLEVIASLPAIVLLLLSIFLIDLTISLSALVIVGGFYSAVFVLLIDRRKQVKDALKEAGRQANSESLNLFNGIKMIKVHGKETYYTARYAEHSSNISTMNSRLPMYISLPRHLIEPLVFGALISYVLIIVNDGASLADALPVLGVVALAGYKLIPAVQNLYARLSQISALKHSLEEVFDELVLIENSTMEPPRQVETDQIRDEPFSTLTLKNVCFSYPGTHNKVLQDIDLTISRGDAIAITGTSGSGKSTLVDIILGLHRPGSGALLLNDQAMTEAQLRRLQAKIGYVQQDCFLTSGSIADNIAFGINSGEVDKNLLMEVCKKAQILDFIVKELPQGFDTTVGERGVKLSGGQRQRVALARALYRKPDILVLDEATSALDNETESLVTQAIDSLQGNVTLLVIAHRSNTIEKIPQKFVLANGHLTPAQ